MYIKQWQRGKLAFSEGQWKHRIMDDLASKIRECHFEGLWMTNCGLQFVE